MAGRATSLVLMVLFLSLTGCVVRQGDFTVASNKVVNLAKFELGKADRAKNVVGEDIKHIFLFVPTGEPSLEAAFDDAFRKADGDAMTDVVIESWGWYIPYIYGQSGWRVKGDVVKTRTN